MLPADMVILIASGVALLVLERGTYFRRKRAIIARKKGRVRQYAITAGVAILYTIFSRTALGLLRRLAGM